MITTTYVFCPKYEYFLVEKSAFSGALTYTTEVVVRKATFMNILFIHAISFQGMTNPLPSSPGQVQILVGQVIFYFTCPEKCIDYIRNIVISSYFQDAVDCRASG